MLASITWTTFASSLLLLLTLYYLIIAYRFYLPGLRHKNKAIEALPSVLFAVEEDKNESAMHDEILDITGQEPEYHEAERIDQFITKLKNEIALAAEKTVYKAELMMQIKPILSTYHDLKDSPYQPAINELLLSETKTLGSMALREEDLVELWDA